MHKQGKKLGEIREIVISKEAVDWFLNLENSFEITQDVIDEEDVYKVVTTPEDFQSCVETLESNGFKGKSAELTRIAENLVEVTDEKIATNILRLMSKLEEHDDVQNVYSNFDISDELMEKLDV